MACCACPRRSQLRAHFSSPHASSPSVGMRRARASGSSSSSHGGKSSSSGGSSSHGHGVAGEFLTERRMAEMDWDRDGTITFKEFVFAFASWVGMDEGGDEE